MDASPPSAPPASTATPSSSNPSLGLLASANRVPQSADNSIGYLRRWLVVPFDATLNESILDRSILDKLTSPDELSGLLNHAVSAYRQVLEKGTLTESEKMVAAKEGFDQESDSTRLFLNERTEECSSYDEIERAELYAAYKDWCASNRLKPVTAHHLYNSVWETFRIETHKRRGRRLFQGIRLVSEDAESQQ